jgi:hypothetical protein
MTTDNIDLDALFTRLDACREAREWAAGKTLEQAWAECPRGDWMLWLAGMLGIDRKVLVRATCACARLALPHVPAGERRPLKSIKAAEAWTRGKATIEDVRAAAEAALEAAWTAWEAVDVEAWTAAAAAWASAAAAWASAWTAACASAEASAWTAACASAEAKAAAETAAWGAKLEPKRAKCADIVREHVSYELIAEAARREAAK